MNHEAILVNIDDVDAERSARNAVLAGAGFLVHDATTMQQALDLVERHNPDLLIVHLRDGHDTESWRRLKLQDRGVSVLQVGASAASIGADALLPESADAAVLLQTIRGMLHLREKEQALTETNARLEAAHQELRRSSEDFQHFAYIVSHDLQESLRAVRTFVELLDREAQDRLTETEKGYVSHVVDGANRMRGLIEDLLAYSRVGRENQTNGVVGMSAVVTWAIGDLGKLLDETGAIIHVAERLPKVWGDFAQLGQVIRNLLSNAIKFRKPDIPPLIDIGGQEHDPEQCLISIRDNGIGIAPEYLEKIFAPFKRLHGPEVPGTGMGLAVCRRIMDLHGGSIWVESEPQGGSTFFIRLPAAGRTANAERG